MAFLRNCFEEGSNLAILSRNYTIPEDNPYGDGLVELIDRMLTVDYKARADMTEVILCLSAVYSGRPLPPRKRSAKTSKSEEKEHNKKTTSGGKKEDPSIGKFRTDSQGFRDENIYDPSKVTEGKKLASNSVAARRKRAAVSSTAVTTSGPTPSQPAAPSSSTDPLHFSSIQGSEDETASDVAFTSFGDLNGEIYLTIFKTLISINIVSSFNLTVFCCCIQVLIAARKTSLRGLTRRKMINNCSRTMALIPMRLELQVGAKLPRQANRKIRQIYKKSHSIVTTVTQIIIIVRTTNPAIAQDQTRRVRRVSRVSAMRQRTLITMCMTEPEPLVQNNAGRAIISKATAREC